MIVRYVLLNMFAFLRLTIYSLIIVQTAAPTQLPGTPIQGFTCPEKTLADWLERGLLNQAHISRCVSPT